MKYIKQFGIIVGISFIGEILNHIIPLPIPASIYGLIIIFVCLCTGVIKLEQIKDVAKFLLEIMPLMFIPAAVGVMNAWQVIKPSFLPILTITIVSTIVVMGVTGRVTQAVIRSKQKKIKK